MNTKSQVATLGHAQTAVLETNKVIRNTYMLLSLTLAFSALTAGASGLVVLAAATGKPMQSYPLGSSFAGDLSWEGDSLAFLNSFFFFFWAKNSRRLP